MCGASITQRLPKGRLSPLGIAFIYVLAAGLWILFSDTLLAVLVGDSDTLASLEIIKGWMFVVVTGGMLYLLIRHSMLTLQHSEEARRRTELQYRSLVERVPAVTYVAALDEASSPVYVSPQIETILGFAPAEWMADPHLWLKQLHPDDRQRVLAIVAHSHTTGEPFRAEYRLIARDGHMVWIRDEATVASDGPNRRMFRQGIMLDITEPKQIEEALLATETKFHSLVEQSLTGIYIVQDEKFSYVNPRLAEIFGYRPDELIAVRSPLDLTVEDDRAIVSDNIRRCLEGEIISIHYTFRGLRKDGTTVVIEVHGTTTELNGQIAIIGTLIDITERKHAEEAERQQRTLAEALRDTAAVLNSTLDFDEVLDRILANVGRVVPHDAATIMLIESGLAYVVRWRGHAERGLQDWIPAVRLPVNATANLRQMTDTGRPLSIPDTHDDSGWVDFPETRWVRSYAGAPIRIKGQVVGFLNLDSQTPGFYSATHAESLLAFADQAAIAIQNARLHEQVQRHAAELEQRVADRTAELDQERKRTQAILDAAGEGILFTDPAGSIVYVNQAIEQLTGYAAGELLGQNPRLWQSGHTSRAVYDHMWQTIRRGDVWQGDMINRRKDGTLYDTAVTIAPLSGTDGHIIGYVGIQRDITHQKELDRLKDQFVSNVSHEIRTPLSNVKLYLSLLERGRADKRDQYLQTLHRETARLENLIEDLLDISRLDLGATPMHPVPTDVNQLLAQLITDRLALAADHGLSLDYMPDVDLPPGLADPAMLSQVISNLMGNAINYTPRGGIITVGTALRSDDDREWIAITVQDTGPGISDHDLPHLFERFYRGEIGRNSGAPGTGLGLAICKEIIEKMDGRITVDSQPDQGAAFTVWLRLAELS